MVFPPLFLTQAAQQFSSHTPSLRKSVTRHASKLFMSGIPSLKPLTVGELVMLTVRQKELSASTTRFEVESSMENKSKSIFSQGNVKRMLRKVNVPARSKKGKMSIVNCFIKYLFRCSPRQDTSVKKIEQEYMDQHRLQRLADMTIISSIKITF